MLGEPVGPRRRLPTFGNVYTARLPLNLGEGEIPSPYRRGKRAASRFTEALRRE